MEAGGKSAHMAWCGKKGKSVGGQTRRKTALRFYETRLRALKRDAKELVSTTHPVLVQLFRCALQRDCGY